MTLAIAVVPDPPAPVPVRIEITDLAPFKIGGQLRWSGRVRLPRALRPRAVVVFLIDDKLIGIPSSCPHEQANMAEGRFVEKYVLECPLHQNTYDLRGSALKPFRVEAEGERLFLLWDQAAATPVAPAFGDADEAQADDTKIAMLERELEHLKEAADARERKVVETLTQMDAMIREVEGQRSELAASHRELASLHAFTARVTDTMSEVLVVVDTAGKITEANRQAEVVLGAGRDALRARPLAEVLDGASADALAHTLTALGQDPAELDGGFVGPAGPSDHLLRAVALYGASGKRQGTVVVGTDVSRLRAAQREVADAYAKVTHLLDSMRQAVFVVLASGEIIGPVSRAAAAVFGRDIVGANVFDVLYKDLDREGVPFQALQAAYLSSFDAEDWQWMLVDEHFPRRVLLQRAHPPEEPAILRVDYCPLRDPAGLMDRLMIVVDDVTHIELLEQERQASERQSTILGELAAVPAAQLREFFCSAQDQLRAGRQLLTPSNPAARADAFRALHTLKGNARMLHLSLVAQATHEVESAARRDETRDDEPRGADTVREQLGVVSRHLAEYSALAERFLHVPNDAERNAVEALHAALTTLDLAAARAADGADPRLLSAVAAARLEVEQADAPAVAAALSELAAGLQPTEGRAPAVRGELRSLLERVASAGVARVTESTAAQTYPLARSRWTNVYRAAYALTCASCGDRPLSAAELGPLIAAVEVAVDDVSHHYALALVRELGGRDDRPCSPTVRRAVRELWRHLAFHAVLESVALLRPSEREHLRAALACLDDDAQLARLAALHPTTLTTFLEAERLEGRSAREVFSVLAAVFAGTDVDTVARGFVAGEVADPVTALAALGSPTGPAAEGPYRALGGSLPLFPGDEPVATPYLKQLDIARMARTVAAFHRGNFQLAFEDVPTVEVMTSQVRALRDRLRQLRLAGGQPELGEIERAVARLGDVPVVPALLRFHAVVADLTVRLGKRAELRVSGDNTLGLPRPQLTNLLDGLGHLIRNACDHGLDTPAERAIRDKPEVGLVEVSCVEHDGGLVVSVRDDGRGIDPARLRARAIALGTLSPAAAAALDDAAALDLIFAARFSTATTVTDVSGRGIGLDAVRAAVSALGGRLTLRTAVGVGTTFTITLPPLDVST